MTGQDPVVADLNLEFAIPQGGALSRIIYQDKEIQVALFVFAPGIEWREPGFSVETPPMLQILRGEGYLITASGENHLSSGAWLRLEAGETYSIKAESELVLVRTHLRGNDD